MKNILKTTNYARFAIIQNLKKQIFVRNVLMGYNKSFKLKPMVSKQP